MKQESRVRLTAINVGTGSRKMSLFSTGAISDSCMIEDYDESRLSAEIARNRDSFEQRFRPISLRIDGVVMWMQSPKAKKSKPLYASYLKSHIYMHPALVSSIFHPGSLDQIIEEMRIQRGENSSSPSESEWEKIKTELGVDDDLIRLRSVMNEASLSHWFVEVLRDFNRLSRHRQLSSAQLTFGLKGALAVPSGTELPGINPNAGYLSNADLVFLKEGKPFAVVEFKMEKARATANTAWYKHDAVLAQIFCGLSGAESCSFGLVLTQKGFKFLYRIKQNDIRQCDTPLYKYSAYPSDDPLARYTDDKVKFEELLRIMYELTLLSSNDTGEPPRTKKPRLGTQTNQGFA